MQSIRDYLPSLPDKRTLFAASCFFLVLCGYYLLRPLRDEMGIQGGIGNLHWMWTATFVFMIIANFAYGWLSSRVARNLLVPAIYVFIAAVLALFFVGEFFLSPPWYARAMYVWISVINLFLISGFWAVLSDVFPTDVARRRFGMIAAGGTLGAIVGPGIAAGLVETIQPQALLYAGAACFVVAAFLLRRISSQHTNSAKSRRLEKFNLYELLELGKDRRLLGLTLAVFLHSVVATFIYVLQAKLLEANIADSAARVQIFSLINLSVNVLAVFTQLFITHALLRFAGLAVGFTLLPIAALLGLAAFVISPFLITVLVLNVIQRATNFAVSRPAREVLFTLLPMAWRYRSRILMDTLVYRASDVVGIWLVTGLFVVGLPLAGTAAIAVPIAAFWTYLNRRTARIIQLHEKETGNERQV